MFVYSNDSFCDGKVDISCRYDKNGYIVDDLNNPI